MAKDRKPNRFAELIFLACLLAKFQRRMCYVDKVFRLIWFVPWTTLIKATVSQFVPFVLSSFPASRVLEAFFPHWNKTHTLMEFDSIQTKPYISSKDVKPACNLILLNGFVYASQFSHICHPPWRKTAWTPSFRPLLRRQAAMTPATKIFLFSLFYTRNMSATID